jgi:glycosyltransferase involved in cell wall biosynthesis
MPTKGRADLVRRAVQSVCSQTFQGWELILLDDSPPSIKREIFDISRDDSRIRFAERNGVGPDHARKIGVQISGGQYTTFLDSDDVWHRDRLREHLEVWTRHKIGLSWDRWAEVERGEVRVFPQPVRGGPIRPPRVAKMLFAGNFIHCSAGLTTKRLIEAAGGYPTWTILSDWALYMMLAEQYPCFMIDRTLTFKDMNAPERLGEVEHSRTIGDHLLLRRYFLLRRPDIYGPLVWRERITRFFAAGRKSKYLSWLYRRAFF